MSKSIDEFLDRKLERLKRIESIYGGFEKESDAYTYELLKELREYRQLKAAGLLVRVDEVVKRIECVRDSVRSTSFKNGCNAALIEITRKGGAG